jgi:hypothetical protein
LGNWGDSENRENAAPPWKRRNTACI